LARGFEKFFKKVFIFFSFKEIMRGKVSWKAGDGSLKLLKVREMKFGQARDDS